MSKPRFFRKVLGGSSESSQLQNNVGQALGSVLKSQLLDGRLIEDVELASGNTRVEHKLARAIKGYIIVKRSNGSTIYNYADDEKFLTLNASGSVTVSLWVF